MRLFWKLFCSMVVITTAACSLGGYLLIDTQFHASLKQEVAAVYEENDMLRYALVRETQVIQAAGLSQVLEAAGSITIHTSRGQVAFRLSGEDGAVLYGSLPVDSTLIGRLSPTRRGWTLTQAGGRYYIHAAVPLSLEDGTLFLENGRDVEGLFLTRQEQYERFTYLMTALVLAVALASLGVSALILRPLKQLSAAAQRMADGALDQRVPVTSRDELGQLSANFNVMASRLERHVLDLTDAARRQQDFLNSFAHETKTPLTSIIGYADLLRSRPASPELVRESADYIFREGARLEALSKKLMDLIVLDKQNFSFPLVPMDAFLSRVAGAMRPVLAAQSIRLYLSAQPAQIPLEPDLMETVCLNLLDNARKAVEAGGGILLEGVQEPDGYCIRVTDNGKGVPPEELGRITEAFYMVDKSRARAQGGAGLGLTICQRIVTLHCGTMDIRSLPGKGTQVSVHLRGGETPCAV